MKNDYDEIMRVLNANADKSFVKRILNRDKYPVLDEGNGQHATHKMAWGETDTPKGKKYVVFPTVLFDGKKLADYGDKAFGHAMKSGNYIEFDDPKQAEWFSKEYKKAWDKK